MLASSKQIFEAGLISLLDAVFNFTTQTTKFKPPYISKALPIDQCDGGISIISTITRSLTLNLRDFEFDFHRIVNMGKYSRTRLLQNISVLA